MGKKSTAQIPGQGELGSSSFYGTEEDLKSVLARYLIHPAQSEFYVQTKREFLEQIASCVQEGDFVLDIGCSFGFVTSEIANMYRQRLWDAKIVGIDIDPRQIENAKQYAEQQGLTNIEFQLCDARNIAGLLADARPTIITSLYAFHHVPDASADDIHADKLDVLKQLHNISEERARLIIGDVTVPVSYTRGEQYVKAVTELCLATRIPAAKRVSEQTAKMESNAAMGVIHRMNEYPITLKEYSELLDAAGWSLNTRRIIMPYQDVVLHYQKPPEQRQST